MWNHSLSGSTWYCFANTLKVLALLCVACMSYMQQCIMRLCTNVAPAHDRYMRPGYDAFSTMRRNEVPNAPLELRLVILKALNIVKGTRQYAYIGEQERNVYRLSCMPVSFSLLFCMQRTSDNYI